MNIDLYKDKARAYQMQYTASGYWLLVAVLAGLMLLQTGCASRTPAAAPTTQTVTSSDPSRRRQDPKEIAKVRTAIAAEFIRNHQLDNAKRQLEYALKADPRSAAAYDMMGVLLQQEGSPINLQKAESYFLKALALDPDYMQAHNNYGVYLAQIGRNAEAIRQFEIAGAALGYDGRASALENLGRTALKVNNVPLATTALLKALNTDRTSVIARTELVDIFLQQNRIAEARELHNDLLRLMADNLDPRTLRQGIQLAHLAGNRNQEQQYTRQLFDRYPLSDEARKVKGWLANPTAAWR